MGFSLTVCKTDTASTKNTNGLRLILAMPTFHNFLNTDYAYKLPPNEQHQQPEPAAAEQRIGTDLIGWLRSAACWG
jgi:hypothetical protein